VTDLIPRLGAWLLQLGVILLLLFWMVGAYNRLMRLRNALGLAWGQIDELLVRRAAALEMLEGAVRGSLADEANSLQALLLAQEAQRLAALAVRARPSSAPLVEAWVAADRELASPMARLHSLIEQQPELDASDSVRPARQQMAELAPRLVYARQAFNEAADRLNAALLEWPTRLLVRLFGFMPVARV
jgi:LemA protein